MSSFIDHLDSKNKVLLQQLDQSEFCRRFFLSDTPTPLIEAMMSSLLDQVHGYGGELTRSISTALGRLASHPQWLPQVPPLMEALLGEVAHPGMAHEDSVKLDRTVPRKESQRPTPAAFVVAAVARFLCEQCHPLSHLGFFYLLEGTTSGIAPRLLEVLKARNIKSPFIELHAHEDVAHSAVLRTKIEEIVGLEPAIAAEIEYGYDCFAITYPMPIWESALDRALQSQIA